MTLRLKIVIFALMATICAAAGAQEALPAAAIVATDTVPGNDPAGTLENTSPTTATAVDTAAVDTMARKPALLAYEPHRGMDWRLFKSVTNPNTKPYTFMQDQTWVGIPLFLSGLIARSEKNAFRQNYNNPNTRIRLIKYKFHSEIDNYTQFLPLALTFGLKVGGMEGRSDWPRLWASSAMSAAIMAGIVNGVKYTVKEMRPDGSTRNSWPSGHTATAFMAATILHKEYGLTRSPWFSVGAYAVATATGVMRVLNNRHWISDVLSGAGIGILSVELGYGICDLLFKGRGLLRNDLTTYTDLRGKPSFFSISMGIGLGNKHLNFPAFSYDLPDDIIDEDTETMPLELKFGSAMAVGAEAAWFFCPYVGVGGRLRVKSMPVKGWSELSRSEEASFKEYASDPLMAGTLSKVSLTVESDRLTEFAADAGVYFSLPLSSRFALGSKFLLGRSVMSDIEVTGNVEGKVLALNGDNTSDEMFVVTDKDASCKWNYANVHASNSMKLGSGLSLTYAHKGSYSWRVFCDYDYTRKTFKASYDPMGFLPTMSPDMVSVLDASGAGNVAKPVYSSMRKSLHQWVIGGALCVMF